MNTDTMYERIKSELDMQRKLLDEVNRQISKVKGYLFVRLSGDHKLYYQVLKRKSASGWKTKMKNISKKHELVRELARKTVNKKMKKIYTRNVNVLEVALEKYIPVTTDVLMPEKYRDILVENNRNTNYKTCPFNPLVHIHAAVCGIMVRSKAEVIIANALWHYGIPFVYEELFPYQSDSGKWYYPDFTIHLPDGRVIIWEHWGLLDKLSYCESNVEKLYTYNANHFTIGKNLIITQDDVDGACDSAFVYHIIEEYILPYFK